MGIGKALVKESLRIGKERGLEEVELEAHFKNEQAIDFYSSLGLRKRMIQFVGKV
jgi:ribosomal protein S18 acetylase RimI-like enzyme